MNNLSDRWADIDFAKSIGIIMVVWAHAYGPFGKYITAFHMPLFFFLSGMTYKNVGSLKNYIGKKANRLLKPFWIWNFLLLIPFWLLYYWKNWKLKVLFTYALQILMTVGKVPMLGATWFLPGLFWTSIIFAIIYKLLESVKWRDGIIAAVAILICFTGMEITFPFRISRVLVCALFYVIGYLYAKYVRPYLKSKKLKYTFAIVAFILYLWFTSINSISLDSNEYRYRILFIIGAILAIYVVLVLSELAVNCHGRVSEKIVGHFLRIGQNTLPIVIWQFIAFRAVIMIQILLWNAPLKEIVSFPIYDGTHGWWFAYLLCGIYGSLAIDWLVSFVVNALVRVR